MEIRLAMGTAVALFAWGSVVAAIAEPALEASAPVEVRIEPPGGDGLWRATYRFVEPVSGLDFQRGGGFRRAPGWRVETPDFVLGGGESRETLRLKPGGKPRREITLAFPVDSSHPEKDYQLFELFSDGGLLLYTGHLNVVPAGSPEDAPTPPHRFVFRARKGEHLVVKGRLHRKSATFRDAEGDGTFVYFGRVAPLETEHMIAVLDPALPAWISRKLHDGIPRLFSDYTRLTSFALGNRPSVLLSFRIAADPRSTVWKGGTLPGIIQMHVEAAVDAPEDLALMRRFYKFLCHEAAHLWNAQLFRSDGRNQSWMHEGGADAFAWRAMRRAGLIDETELEDRQAEDLNECLARLGEDSLQTAEERKDFRAVYSCGTALAWLTEAGTRRVDPSSDLHTFWAALFRAAEPKGRRYDETAYLALLRERKVAPATVSFIDDFINRKMPGRVERTLFAFQDAGIPLKSSPDVIPAAQKEAWGERALVALMRQDCDGRHSVSRARGAFVVNGMPVCRTLKTATEVHRLERLSVVADGELAYDALVARCAAGGSVTLTDREPDMGGVAVPCASSVPPRPPWLAVSH